MFRFLSLFFLLALVSARQTANEIFRSDCLEQTSTNCEELLDDAKVWAIATGEKSSVLISMYQYYRVEERQCDNVVKDSKWVCKEAYQMTSDYCKDFLMTGFDICRQQNATPAHTLHEFTELVMQT